MNRDEHRARAPELPPQMIDARHEIYGPVDPVGGGTWIAHNGAGYWGCLLNGYAEQTAVAFPEAYTSRGRILLQVLSQADPLAAAKALDVSHFLSFRLVIGSPDSVTLLVWDGMSYAAQPFQAETEGGVYFLTSSSWQQEQVIAARLEKFHQWAQQQSCPPSKPHEIPAYHYDAGPDPAIAPFMARSYARTKSITALNVTPTGTTLSYDLIPESTLALPTEAVSA